MKRPLLLGLLLIAVLAGGLLWLRQGWKIDGCLDNGGRWNYQLAACEGV